MFSIGAPSIEAILIRSAPQRCDEKTMDQLIQVVNDNCHSGIVKLTGGWVVSHFASELIAIFGQKIQTETLPSGQTIDFLLTEERDEQAAKCFLTKAIRRHGVPETITSDGSAANDAAIKRSNEEYGTAIEIRQPTPALAGYPPLPTAPDIPP